MRHLHFRELGYTLGVIILLLSLYAGAYYATVTAYDFEAMISSTYPPPKSHPVPFYSFGGEWSRPFFAPMHEIDQMIRPKLWASVGSW